MLTQPALITVRRRQPSPTLPMAIVPGSAFSSRAAALRTVLVSRGISVPHQVCFSAR